jgi:hypothetical protein
MKFPALFLSFVLVVIFIQGMVAHSREHRLIQKELGLWMKDRLSKEGKVMSRLPHEAFYAERDWVRIPEKSYAEVIHEARAKNIRYLIIDDKAREMSPGFLENVSEEDLVRLANWKKKDQTSILYEVLYPLKN